MPKYHLQSDGVVMIESATLDGAMPIVSIDYDEANHLNLGAATNMFATLFRRFAPVEEGMLRKHLHDVTVLEARCTTNNQNELFQGHELRSERHLQLDLI